MVAVYLFNLARNMDERLEDRQDAEIVGCTYAGARNLSEFAENAVVGIQSASGFNEGRPLHSSW